MPADSAIEPSGNVTLSGPKPGKGLRDSHGLTPKERKFLRAVIKTGSTTEAAEAVYQCSNRATARSVGYEVLSRPRVMKAYQAAIASQMSSDLVVANFVGRATSDPAQAFNAEGGYKANIHDIPREARRNIKKVEVEELWANVEVKGEERIQIGVIRKIEFFDHESATEHLARLQALTGFRQPSGATVNVNVGTQTGAFALDPATMTSESIGEVKATLENDAARGAGIALPQALHPKRTWSPARLARFTAFAAEMEAPEIDTTQAETVEVRSVVAPTEDGS